MDIQSTEYAEFLNIENFDLAWRRLRNSKRIEVKDWLGLQIYASTEHKLKHLEMIIHRIEQGYIPDVAYPIYRPKQDRSLREFSFLSMDDRLVYQALGNRIIYHSYDEIKSLSRAKRIYGNIPIAPDIDSDFVFHRPFTRWVSRTTRMEGQYDLFYRDVLITGKLMTLGVKEPWLIKTDIVSYYPTINHNILLDILARCAWLPDENLQNLLDVCLKKWTTSPHAMGIPIGYETSDHLANLYLLSVDNGLVEFNVKRYVDDIYIFVSSFEDAKRALYILDCALDKLQLKRNTVKTELIPLKETNLYEISRKLKKSLSHLASPRKAPASEQFRQTRLLEKFHESYVANSVWPCSEQNIRDSGVVAFTLYRLTKRDATLRNVALCMLDHYPNYSFHVTTYLSNNFSRDAQSIEALRKYLGVNYEPTRVQLDCLFALKRMMSFRKIKSQVLKLIKDSDDWFMRYSLLRDFVQTNLHLVSLKVLDEFISIEKHPVVLLQAIWLRFFVCDTGDEMIQIVNQAIALAGQYEGGNRFAIEKMSVVLWDEYKLRRYGTLNVVALSAEVRNYILRHEDIEPFEEFFANIHQLFDIHLNDTFPVYEVFGDLEETNQELRSAIATIEREMNKFTGNLYALTFRLLAGVARVTFAASIESYDLRQIVDIYFPEDDMTESNVEKLIIYQERILKGERIKESKRDVLRSEIQTLFRYHTQGLQKQLLGETMRDEIFISYSHKDEKWRTEVEGFLKPHIRDKNITVWHDKRIEPGKDWEHEIKEALQRAKVAILLVSKDFLESNYVHNNELPEILTASQKDYLKIVWIAVSPSGYKATPIGKLQCAHSNPDRSLSSIPKPRRQAILVEIADYIASLF